MVEDSRRDSIAEIGLALRRRRRMGREREAMEANCKWDDKKWGEEKKKEEKQCRAFHTNRYMG